MYQFERMNKKLLASQVEDELMNYILKEPVEIGQKIPNEYELAEKFGVGRSTIRETVKSLASKGILEVRRGSGTFVVSTNKLEDDPLGFSQFSDKYELALELVEVRLMIEPNIAALAAENAEEEDKRQLKKLCDETEELFLAGKNHANKDVEFHTYIAKCSKNRVIEILQPIIQSSVLSFVNLTKRKLLKETIYTHRAIVEAIEKGDSAGARYASIMHLTYNRQMLMQIKETQDAEREQEIRLLTPSFDGFV